MYISFSSVKRAKIRFLQKNNKNQGVSRKTRPEIYFFVDHISGISGTVKKLMYISIN